MKVSYLGTTMLLFDDGRDQLLFDCHVTRPGLLRCLLGTLDTDKEVAERVIADFAITRLRGIFISHSHHDHVLDAPYFAQRTGAKVYGSPSALQVIRGGEQQRAFSDSEKKGGAEEKLFSYSERMDYELGEFSVRVLPSLHSKAHWYNNDLGQTIDRPLVLPARKKEFKEGGSFDFLLTHQGRRYLIRPSYNYIPGQLEGIRADVLFLGIGGLGKDEAENRERFFAETVDRVCPELVIPVHWDHFFKPLYGPVRGLAKPMDNTGLGLSLAAEHCRKRGISFVILPPLGSMEL